jgi:transcription-repair coupling factor (superfamily II helicase)
MIFDPLSTEWKDGQLDGVLEAFAAGKQVQVSGLKGCAAAFYLAMLQQNLKMPLVVITSSTDSAEALLRDLTFFTQYVNRQNNSSSRVVYFPSYDTEPYQGASPHPQISAMRMQTLWHLLQGGVEILVLPVKAATQKIAPPDNLQRSVSVISSGENRSPMEIATLLQKYGYQEKDLVTSKGEFSLRGGILDFYSPAEELPLRIEFFGNKIESLRSFESNTQRSVAEKSSATILGLQEILVSQKEIDSWGEFSAKRWAHDFHHEELVDKTEQLLEHGTFEGNEEFVSAFFETPATILDYLPKDACLALDSTDSLSEVNANEINDYRKRFEQIRDSYRLAMEPEEIFEDWGEFFAKAQAKYILRLEDLVLENEPDRVLFEYAYQSARQYNGQVQEIINDALRLREMGFTSFYVFPNLGKAERLADILNEYNSPALFFSEPMESQEQIPAADLIGKTIICIGNLSHGFKNPELQTALFTEDDLFGEFRPVIQTTPKKSAGTFLSDLRDLKMEDYVVHVDHGIGQFIGLSTMNVEGREKEFLLLRFAEDDKLYVPVERLDLVQKYMGASEGVPRLDRLGTGVWQKTKSRAKASMKEMAEKLLQLYAYRKTAKGYSFGPDDSFQREFEEAFEFQETPHQISAIEDVKSDMESDKPMDRLICGDVGYGKTEVAMRAAFKAVKEGKQVALLAPTTILVFQHYHTFRKRFEMFPVRIEMISRFKSTKEIKKTLEDTRNGKVDILIGTHRLLSKDVHFQDLALLVVDEEQRFGVAHKERLKEMKRNVDALTLTATPIPRTLQMALMGFRPMSVIETPPKDRLAIQTNVVKYNEDTIAASIRTELKRGGQTYLVHNRVETIYSVAAMVKRIVPEARVAVAHGQMPERELEKAMLQFINHEFDVLVSTTIIENGIDIPLVNTLIVNRADKFGLSQLYQLRGRVGRSHHRAYAHLMIPSERDLTPIARRRLAALREFTELGSGFRLAALDLEIRGAGNLLGSEQHGHIAALGFELYCRMLEQTVKEIQGEEVTADFSTNINLQIDIRIPEDYIPNMNQRLNLYKRIAACPAEETLQQIREEMQDRFGPLPEAVQHLIEYGRLKLLAEKLLIKSVDSSDGHLFFQLSENGPVDAETILKFIKAHKGASLSPSGLLSCPAEKLHIPDELFATVQRLLAELNANRKVQEIAS